MIRNGHERMQRIFRFILARRWWIVVIYALLVPPSIWVAMKVEQDDSLNRLIVKSDPDFIHARQFEKVFGSGEYAILLAEARDPFAPDVLARVDQIEKKLQAIPKVETSSAISIYRRVRPGFEPEPGQVEAFRRFITGTDLFRKQGLVGEGFLGIPLVLRISSPSERNAVLAAVDAALDPFVGRPAPLEALRKVGGVWVDAYLERETSASVARYFPLFGVFIIALNLFLYRSFRALAAFMLTIGSCVALTVGYVGVTGGVLTIVSSLVPMTILITCTATLVYIHSRFVEQPEGISFEDHQVFALANKFLPCSASIFATAVGFAALTISKIRPIRDLGTWVAVGIVITWVTVFTLFPALQRILGTPTHQERRTAGRRFLWFMEHLPLESWRWRWLLVPGSLGLCLVGAVALFGFPGLVAPMKLETDGLEYINHDLTIYKDTKRLEKLISGLSVTEVWLRGPVGSVSEPEVLRGLDRFARGLEADARIGAVVGLPTVVRLLRYVGGGPDTLPTDPVALEKLAGDFEQLVPGEPMLQGFVDRAALSQTHLSVITRSVDYEAYAGIERLIRERWGKAVAAEPALAVFRLSTAGEGPLQAKIAYYLVPTLVESFGLTVVIIFITFLIVFRNGAARLMAMIPSLFAILVMFAFMRVMGIGLNVATILIASTVLGSSENDQIHFFYHFLEKGRGTSTEQALRHTLEVAGRAIVFATLINAGGFLAFALSDLPPLRHFGLLTALAFVLSMIADFSALPAALWIVFRDRPDALKPAVESTTEPAE